jgi:hypothetical protein
MPLEKFGFSSIDYSHLVCRESNTMPFHSLTGLEAGR